MIFDVCNFSGTTQAAISDIPVRVITFGYARMRSGRSPGRPFAGSRLRQTALDGPLVVGGLVRGRVEAPDDVAGELRRRDADQGRGVALVRLRVGLAAKTANSAPWSRSPSGMTTFVCSASSPVTVSSREAS